MKLKFQHRPTNVLVSLFLGAADTRAMQHNETWSLSRINFQLLWGEYLFNEGSGSLICILTGVRPKQRRVIAGGAEVPGPDLTWVHLFASTLGSTIEFILELTCSLRDPARP
jgi:hypothetical protein